MIVALDTINKPIGGKNTIMLKQKRTNGFRVAPVIVDVFEGLHVAYSVTYKTLVLCSDVDMITVLYAKL